MKKEKPWEYEKPSKSQRKRDMQALQNLGEQLSQLRVDQLRAMNADGGVLEDRLLITLLEAQKMSQREARRRHLQLVGKLLRGAADIEGIQAAYEATQAGSQAAQRALHELEFWRERLLAEGDEAIGEALLVFVGAESSHLRQLVRDAKQELSQHKPPTSTRKLFQYMKGFQVNSSASAE